MKKFLFIVFISLLYSAPSQAQLLDRIRNKMEQKVTEKIDQSIDKATQKKKKKDSNSTSDKPASTPGSTPDSSQTPSNSGTAGARSESAPVEATPVKAGPKSAPVMDITAYSRFDFIPGDKIIAHEDFSQTPIGDFPDQWNTRSGAEVVTVGNRSGKWLRMNQQGVYYPEYISPLPENFTLQMDVMANQDIANIGQFIVSFFQTKSMEETFKTGESQSTSNVPNFKVSFQPRGASKGELDYSSNVIGSQHKNGLPEFNIPNKPTVKVSIWRQKQRVRVYLDSTKVLDLPRALDPNTSLNTLTFATYAPDYESKNGSFYMSNIVLAVGASDTRNKLITAGKFSTHGILFDVNSDQIKPQSYGTLQDIAQVLKDNAGVRVKIVGHTDADGTDATNLDLSKRRAEAVKQTLTKNFGIDAARLESDGKGKSEPIDSNDTAVGKANNRRVEFIKL